MRVRYVRHLMSVILTVTGVCASLAGQSAEPLCTENDPDYLDCEEPRLEYVIVTATRRETLVQQVPTSVTALSGDRLQEMGALGFEDYARFVPGLSFADAGFGGQKHVIRGVSTNILGESRAATAVYLDETPVTDGSFGKLFYSPNPMLVDIDRVEVLRGPQGTLFGSGSMGGAIRIITNQPNVLETEGFAEAGLSTTRHGGPGYDLQAMLNVPLSENRAALRAVAYYQNLDGWIDNTSLGAENVNDNRTAGLRLAALWEDSERLTVNVRAAYQDRESNGTGFDQGNPPWTQQRLVPEPNNDEWSLLNFDIHYRFDWGQLTSATSWLDRTIRHEGDGKAVYQSPFITTVTGVYDNEQQDFTQEFRLQSVGEKRFDWLVGLFYQDQDYHLHHELVVPGFDERTGGLGAAFGTPDKLLVAETDRPTKQTAAFGDVIYRFSERWESTLGGRWFRFKYANDSSVIGPLAGEGSFYQGHASESGFTPRFSLSYQSSDELIMYGTIAGGYRPGSSNETVFDEWPACRPYLDALGLTGVPPAYQSDSLWSYELGIKSDWPRRRVSLNAALFYLDWTDMQTPAALPCGAQWVQNAGEATSKGAEIELVAWPARDIELRLNGAWTDARLDEDVILLGAQKGDRVPGVPRYAFGGSLTWFFDAFGGLDGSVRADYQYVGSSPNGYTYFFTPSEIPSYSLVNLRLGLGKGRWNLALYCDNLFNERVIVTVHDVPEHWVVTARPFTVGISVRFVY